MIRFRNPISDMNILIDNFRKMYVAFSNMEYFDLDNIAEFFAREQLASSSGYIGDEALKRSYLIKDDSRKSMKMQAKSYSELFRFLGWITSGEKALYFNFTYLGVHVALSGEGAKSIFEQCLLGIEYPNHILNVKFQDKNRPFVNMLLFAKELDGKICRDEILLGPMNLLDAYSEKEFSDKLEFIKSLRSTRKIDALNKAIDDLSSHNKMQPTSVRNLTRFVISALEYSGWFEKKALKIYDTPTPFLKMTPKGCKVVSELKKTLIISGNSINVNDISTKEFSEIALLCMFNRANFDVTDEINAHKQTIDAILQNSNKEDILFSPYQFFSRDELQIVLPQNMIHGNIEHRTTEVVSEVNLLSHKSQVLVKSQKTSLSRNEHTNIMLQRRLSDAPNIEACVDTFLKDIETMKQSDFYPLVANLLGFIFNREAFAPPAGNNNMRYDVMIPDERYSIPVEVKSPTEEEMLSVKAIRQATENKVLLLARKPYPTTYEVSSFACGFKLPNERSDVYKLIEDIYTTYKINIAIIDMKSLVSASLYCAQTNRYYEITDFINVRGVIDFEDLSK